ncbi:MAG: hypothetical protein FD152_2727 [Xanthobacteraceae bacterium]|nr:MAG: hypothetical protein FD152_2727 [Xanthobacteraceae bacterium]
MTIDPPDNIVHFPGLQSPEQDADPHRGVIVSLAHIITNMGDLVIAINEGPTTDTDKVKYTSWLCSASALCLRAQLEYFDQFIGGRERVSDAPAFDPPLRPGPPT